MLKAIAFRVIVKADKIEERTDSGIYLAQDERQIRGAQIVGTIVDIGPDAWKAYNTSEEFAGLKIGDKVFYAKYAGKVIKETKDSDELVVLNDEDIVCKQIEGA